MPARTLSVFAVCTGVCFASANVTQAQEATSANLPDQFQTGEMIQIQKPKKKKGKAASQTVATASKQDAAPAPEQMPAVEEVPAQIAPAEEKKVEPNRSAALIPPTQKSATPTEQASSPEEPAVVTVPLPEYTYEMKRRNLSGNGVCVVTVDSATGTVLGATMFPSTGSPVLDKLTIQTFKSWRFKPGSVSQVRIPITYE